MVSDRFLKAYKFLCLTTLALIALGASVRAMNAGLACPDWPLCFGDVIPDYHPQVYFEFIHRVLAGIVGLGIFYLNFKLIRNKKVPEATKSLCWLSYLLLIVQVIMGGLTVLWALHDKVVTLHLTLGLSLFACLIWIYFSLKDQPQEQEPRLQRSVYLFSLVTMAVIVAQIVLGGLVASNYAGLVCTDFPLCHGKFIPTFSGIIGLQVIHRLGAYFTTLVAIAFAVFVLRSEANEPTKKYVKLLVILVVAQVGVGISNIVFYLPPVITVLHSAFAALILATQLRIIYFLGLQIPGVKKAQARPLAASSI